jgi:iduronate 2-sulfatase
MKYGAVRVLELGCAVLLCSLWALAAPAAAQQTVTVGQVSVTSRAMQPNLLFIYVDDLNTDIDLPVVSTPNIDNLAARGVHFRSAYAPHSICNPSRVSLLTGLRTVNSHCVSNGYHPPALELQGLPYLPCRLKDAGYFTSEVGKVFHHDQPGCSDEAFSFISDPWVSQPTDPSGGGSFVIYGGPFLNGPMGTLGKIRGTKATDKTVKLLEDGALRFLQTGQPFSIWLGYQMTHSPFIYPERFLDDYTAGDVPPLPEGEAGSWKESVNTESYTAPWFYDEAWGTTEDERRIQAQLAYFRCIAHLDEQVGRLLDTLDALQLTDNTLVVFVSDHGFSFSRHDHVGKSTGFEEDARAPLIVAAPGLLESHGGSVVKPVDHVDLYPTIVELLELEPPVGLDGASLVPLLKNPAAFHPPAFYTTDEEFAFSVTRYVVKQDTVTGDIWKLAAWENATYVPQVHQLYNLSTDPGEYSNLHTSPDLVEKVAELRQHLLEVGMLGPRWRNFSGGQAGTLGVPALKMSGLPVLGGEVILQVGNSSGVTAPGVQIIGLGGAYPVFTGIAVQQTVTQVIFIPAEGLSIPYVLSDDPALHEVPIGYQVYQLDPGGPGGLSISRALSVFQSQ